MRAQTQKHLPSTAASSLPLPLSPPSLPLPVSHLLLCSSHRCFPLSQFVSLLLSKRRFPSSFVLLAVIFAAVLFVCLCSFSPSSPPPRSPPVNISLCSSVSLILSLLFSPILCRRAASLSAAVCDAEAGDTLQLAVFEF